MPLESRSTQVGGRRLRTQLNTALTGISTPDVSFGEPQFPSFPSLRSILPAAHDGEAQPESRSRLGWPLESLLFTLYVAEHGSGQRKGLSLAFPLSQGLSLVDPLLGKAGFLSWYPPPLLCFLSNTFPIPCHKLQAETLQTLSQNRLGAGGSLLASSLLAFKSQVSEEKQSWGSWDSSLPGSCTSYSY